MAHSKTRNELLNKVTKNCKFLELGVFRGEFAKKILQIVEPSELYLVDIWSGEAGSGDKDGIDYIKIHDMRSVYLNLFHQVKNRPSIHLVRCETVPFLMSCEDDYFDAVYVDADHSEEAVYNDMVNSFRVIKSSGLLMGHDYHHQIKIAVDRFCIDYSQKIIDVTDDGCPSFVIQVSK